VPDDAIVITANMDDNPWAPIELIKERETDRKGDPDKYAHIWEGAYLKNTEGDYYKKEMAAVRAEGRIRFIPKLDIPVNTFWDIGNSDGCAVWLHQSIGMEDRFIGYYEAHGETLAHYVKEMRSRGHIFNKHFLPHDAAHKRLSDTNKSVEQMLTDLGLVNTVIVPVITELNTGIQITRKHFPSAWFDDEGCKCGKESGIKRLDNYRKRYNKTDNRWIDEPNKANGCSEAADAFRQWAQAKESGMVTLAGSIKPRERGKSARDHLDSVVGY
jgi:hypothetical protein